jgi:chaperonin cofactor prefoldin
MRMPPKNPSELQRLTEELSELKKEFKNLSYPKGYREAVLRDIRKIEATLEIPENKCVKV